MDFRQDELDAVHSHWTDVSQDIDDICQETGLDRKRVEDILQFLSKSGKIEDYELNENKVFKFKQYLKLF